MEKNYLEHIYRPFAHFKVLKLKRKYKPDQEKLRVVKPAATHLLHNCYQKYSQLFEHYHSTHGVQVIHNNSVSSRKKKKKSWWNHQEHITVTKISNTFLFQKQYSSNFSWCFIFYVIFSNPLFLMSKEQFRTYSFSLISTTRYSDLVQPE